ncbi:MAG: hypothetical protein LBP53_01605 [Candidatus Peribacteria bacterium]|nr:hypothetical protein [Candidatus Peribacteria bacterium]
MQWLPNPVIEQIEQQGREKAIQEQQLLQEQPDEQEQANLETTLLPEEVLPSEPEETPVSHLTDLLMGQATLSQQMNEQFAQISALITQQFQNATALCQ